MPATTMESHLIRLLLSGSPLALCLIAASALGAALSRLLLTLAFLLLVCKAERGDMPVIARELSSCFSRQPGSRLG